MFIYTYILFEAELRCRVCGRVYKKTNDNNRFRYM